MKDGALLLDKPVGLSSNAALQRAKRACRARKAGHAGTLDPLASGLLVVLFGEATKFAGPLLDDDKEYLATLRLGERTATGDAEGEVVERCAVPADLAARLPGALAQFVGRIEQVPPMYSALKREGIPLYKHARRGETVERQPRAVEIRALEVVRVQAPRLELRVLCSKGTYVRTLAEDLGRALGTAAHLVALRRTGSGGFSVKDAVPLDALESDPSQCEARLVPLAKLLAGLPRAELDTGAEARFRNGQALPFEGREGLCGVYSAQGAVIGLGRADGGGKLRPVRVTASQEAEKHQKTL